MRAARLWTAAVLLVLCDLLIGCATRVIVYPPQVQIAVGHAQSCDPSGHCVSGGEVSTTFAALVGGIATLASEFFGDGPEQPPVVNVQGCDTHP